MLKGNRNYQDGLWDTQMTKASILENNYYSIIDQYQHQDNTSSHQDYTTTYLRSIMRLIK